MSIAGHLVTLQTAAFVLTEVGKEAGQASVCPPQADQPSQLCRCLIVCVYICQGLLPHTPYEKKPEAGLLI